MSGKTTWIIGGDPGCDLVVELLSVSRRHCRLNRKPDGSFTVEDLGSTNGTYVNGQRIAAETPIKAEDGVTLGVTVPMPWPAEATAEAAAAAPAPAPTGARVLRVGREPDNDVVIDSPEVSGHHALVTVAPGGLGGIVEDLGSTNGTAVGSAGQRVKIAALTPADVVYFGPVAVPAATFFAREPSDGQDALPELTFTGAIMSVGREPGNDLVLDKQVVSSRHARFVRVGDTMIVEDLGSSNGTFVNGRRVDKTATVAPGDLIGLGSYTARLKDGALGVIPGPTTIRALDSGPYEFVPDVLTTRPATPRPRSFVVSAALALGVQSLLLGALIYAAGRVSTASGLFAMSLASVWVGVTAGFQERFIARKTPKARPAGGNELADLARSDGRAAIVAWVYSLVLIGLLPLYIPVSGQLVAAYGVIGLTVLVGATLGLAITRVSDRFPAGIAAAAVLVLFMGLLSSPARTAPGLGPVGRLAASVLPSRWCFEAISLLSAGDRAENPADDPVEPFFPAETDRSGTPACVTALVAMLVGLLYVDAVIALSRTGRPDPAVPGSH